MVGILIECLSKRNRKIMRGGSNNNLVPLKEYTIIIYWVRNANCIPTLWKSPEMDKKFVSHIALTSEKFGLSFVLDTLMIEY